MAPREAGALYSTSGTCRRRGNRHLLRPARAIDIAWRAQRRLYRRSRRLAGERGKLETEVALAVARELSCLCREIATLD